MLKDRQKSILEAVIQEHIKTARPVASGDITGRLLASVSPATIRSEMLQLDELGFLEQPHTSAGRIPTDLGYRFFVDNLAEDSELDVAERHLLDQAFRFAAEDEFVREFSRVLSRLSETFTAVGTFEENIFYESGFSEILDEPEFHDQEYTKSFGHFVDYLDEEIKNSISELTEGQIFIGQENPVKSARNYSMIFSTWTHPRGFHGYFTLVGPKRTKYHRHKAILRNIALNHESR